MVFPKVTFTSAGKYYNNGVNVSGGVCTISNSYILGCRSAIRLQSAVKLTLENTVLDGGTYANMQVQSVTELVLKNVTTLQTRKTSVEGNEVMGLGFVFETAALDSTVTLEGDLRQYNWVKQSDADILAQYEGSGSGLGIDFGSFVKGLFKDDQYQSIRHTIEDETGSNVYINTGFLFMGEKAAKFIDSRENKTDIKYNSLTASVFGMSGTIFTYQSDSPIGGDKINSAEDNRFTYGSYAPNAQRVTEAVLVLDGDIPDEKGEGAQYFYYDGEILHIGVTADTPFVFDAANSAQIFKYGISLTMNVFYNNSAVDTISFTTEDKGVHTFTYSAKDDHFFDIYGNPLTGTAKEVNIDLQVSVELAQQPSAEIKPDESNNVLYGRTGYKILFWENYDYYLCIPVLEGLTITDYDEEGNVCYKFENDLLNMPKNLTITVIEESFGGYFKTSEYKTYAGKLYLCSSISDDRAGEDKNPDPSTVKVIYSYVGNNGQTVTAEKTFVFTINTTSIDWDDFSKLS